MRVLSRVALVVVLLAVSLPVLADHLVGDCPLTLVGVTPSTDETDFNLSPHGVFRNGSQVFVLRGQTLTTYTVSALGDLQIAREDFLGELAARETSGGTAYANGLLYVSSSAGLEIFDLRNVRPGGSAPALLSRTPGLHYRRLAVSGSTLAGLFPATDLPCYTRGGGSCFNTIDLYSVASPSMGATRNGTINSQQFFGFNDIAFNQGFLYAASETGIFGFNVNTPGSPFGVASLTLNRATFLVSNTTNLLGVGNEGSITLFTVGLNGLLSQLAVFNLPYEQIDRANPIVFHPQAWLDDQNGRLITLIDELDPQTLRPARTIAFDVFDLTVPMYEGSFQRGYETISLLSPDEVKYNPTAVGPNIYVIGEISGLQAYGACGQMTGRFEYDSLNALNCGGAEIHGWVTGAQKIANVEIFLDNSSLGQATLGGPPRIDVPSRTPVQTWRISVNLDQTARGERTLRAVAEDVFGNRRQVAIQRVFFPGPGTNCSNRRRAVR